MVFSEMQTFGSTVFIWATTKADMLAAHMILQITSIMIKDNVLTVRADATQYEGWFYEGAGITVITGQTRVNSLNLAHGKIVISLL